MNIDQSKLQRADRISWITILGVASVDLAAYVTGFFDIGWASFMKPLCGAVLLGIAGWFYQAVRKEPRLAIALTSTAQMIAFTSVAAPLSYIAASTALPLWDATFIAWDHHLGFDWRGWLTAMNAHTSLHSVFFLSYASIPVQVITTVIALAFIGHTSRLRIFIMSFIFATLVTIAISALMPAQGAWGHLQLSAHDYPAIVPATRDLHLPVFHGLRDGTFRSLLGEGAEGIITFPSLHAALGLLFIFALWPVPYLRWVIAALNIVMIASTPIDGGHYFSDAFAGMMIATLCWTAVRSIIKNADQFSMTRIPSLAAAPSIVPSIMPAMASEISREPQSPEIEPSRPATRTSVISSFNG